MKIYNPEPLQLVRVSISKKEFKTLHLTFHQVTQEECLRKITEMLCEIKVPSIQEKYQTRVDVRSAIGSKNGKSMSVSLKGLTPLDVYTLLVDRFK